MESIQNISILIEKTAAYWEGESADSFRNAASDILDNMDRSFSLLLEEKKQLMERTDVSIENREESEERPVGGLPSDLF